MHPNKFFRNVDMLTETYAPGGVKNGKRGEIL